MKCLSCSCAEEILKADPSQLQARDAVYGGTPLHWTKTAEVKIPSAALQLRHVASKFRSIHRPKQWKHFTSRRL